VEFLVRKLKALDEARLSDALKIDEEDEMMKRMDKKGYFRFYTIFEVNCVCF
jgi:hypothetical protein